MWRKLFTSSFHQIHSNIWQSFSFTHVKTPPVLHSSPHLEMFSWHCPMQSAIWYQGIPDLRDGRIRYSRIRRENGSVMHEFSCWTTSCLSSWGSYGISGWESKRSDYLSISTNFNLLATQQFHLDDSVSPANTVLHDCHLQWLFLHLSLHQMPITGWTSIMHQPEFKKKTPLVRSSELGDTCLRDTPTQTKSPPLLVLERFFLLPAQAGY